MRISADLVCLIVLALWGVILAHLPAAARIRAAGLAWGMGNRTEAPPVPDWVHRADRAFRNHVDNLPLYAIAILTVAVAGKADGVSATAALVLAGARVVHSVSYIAGITVLGLRSNAYFVALGACLVILSRLL
jgi:uncharacterized MAPEG superfamily protein